VAAPASPTAANAVVSPPAGAADGLVADAGGVAAFEAGAPAPPSLGGKRLDAAPALARLKEPAAFLDNGGRMASLADLERAMGVVLDDAQVAALDQQVKAVATRMGLDHAVSFAKDTDFLYGPRFTFIGTFRPWDRPAQPILIGPGILARSVEELAALGRPMSGFGRVVDDFLKLTVEERIEAVLVHESIELWAVECRDKQAHRVAVRDAPSTELTISRRAREHLQLYARVDAQVMGRLP
jgi:hypothetical protein